MFSNIFYEVKYMRSSGCLSFILCICLIICSLSIFAHAIDIEIDLSDLFAPSIGGDTGDTGDTGDNGDDTGDTGNNGDEGKDDSDTDKKPSKPSKPSSSRPGRDDDDDADKKEEEKEEIVYNSTFTDVTEDKWFYSYVTELASKGIIEGYPDESFKPQNNVTRAEFIKLLVVCMGYQTSAMPSFDDVTDGDWFYTYVSTAVKNGIISKEEYGAKLRPNEVISRAEAAKLLVRAAKLETGKYQTPYKDSEDEYVIALYTICLMQGEFDPTTGDRYFKPEAGITRAETSTVFTRLLQYNENPEKFVEEKMEEYGLEELKVLMTDTQSFNSEIYGIGVSPMSFYLYRIDSNRSHDDFSNSLLASYEQAFSHLPEYFTFTDLEITKTPYEGYTEIKASLNSVSSDFSMEDLADMTSLSFIRGKEIIDSLFFDRKAAELSEIEKLKVIYSYLTSKTVYPKEGSERDIDYTAMGVFSNGVGTCQGISAAFNILCRSAGIDACAIAFDNHSFNCVLTDGQYLFFDCTHEITSQKFSETDNDGEKLNYFALSHEKAKNNYGNFPLPLAFWCTLE